MSDPSRNPDFGRIDAIIARTGAGIGHLNEAIRLIKDLSGGLDHPLQQPLIAAIDMLQDVMAAYESTVEHPIQQPLNASQTRAEILAEHRRQHRSGQPSRIASDPELQAFIRARIDTMIFTDIIAAIAAAFPKERRTSLSALSRWWKANQQIPADPK